MSPSRKLKILLLIHEELMPPESLDGFTDDEIGKAPWGAEFDVYNYLMEMGHEVKIQGVVDELKVIRTAIETHQPDIAFNLLEDFGGVSLFDQNVVAYLELKGVPYTGCNPRGLILSRDKALAKSLFGYHRISTPKFYLFRRGKKVKVPRNVEYPLFVKSTTEEASYGISQSSVVHSDAELIERVTFLHESLETHVIAEQYIEGRELYVGMVGNHSVTTFPIWELSFKKVPDNVPNIATPRVKFDPKYRRKHGIESAMAKNLTPEVMAEIDKVCRRAYRVLRLNGYARMDIRLSKENKVYILEANPNPHIGIDEDLAQSAMKAGIKYEKLLQKVLNLGLRWDPSSVG